MPTFACACCGQALQVVMGNCGPHDCPTRYAYSRNAAGDLVRIKKTVSIPPQFERGERDWMV
jgi:hypothetical protein